MHPALLNGHIKATVIESFTGEVLVLSGGFRERVANLPEAMNLIAVNQWEVNVEHIHGSPILRHRGHAERGT